MQFVHVGSHVFKTNYKRFYENRVRLLAEKVNYYPSILIKKDHVRNVFIWKSCLFLLPFFSNKFTEDIGSLSSLISLVE